MSLDVTPFLVPERGSLVDLLGRLRPADWEAPTECPQWTVHGLALHVLGDDLSLLSRQRDAAENGVLSYAEQHPGLSFFDLLDGFNEQWVDGASFLSRELTVELLRLTGQWTSDYYGAVDPLADGEPVGFFGSAFEPSPWWQVCAREYAERWIHHSQIRRALGFPPVAGELAAPAREAVVLGFGARIPALARCSVGERTWVFREEGAAVSLAAEDADALLSRALPFEATEAALHGPPAVVEVVAGQTCLDLRRHGR